MKAIVKAGPVPGVELRREQPEPEIGDDEVLIKVAAASICGTDLHLYAWDKSAQAFNPELPIVLGHEVAGTIERVGSAVKGFAAGDRVAAESHIFCGHCYMCRSGNAHNCLHMKLLGISYPGAFSQYAKLPQQVLFKIPAQLPVEMGALFEGSGVAVHALQRAGDVRGATVLVNGCGPIGMMIVQLALLFGATRAIGIEPNPYRRAVAERLGAIVLDPRTDDVPARVRALTGDRHGADVGFEVSAARGVMPVLFASLRREATLVLIGHPSDPIELDTAAAISKQGVVLKGVFGRRIWETWELFTALVDSGRLDLSWLVTHRLAIEEFERGIELLRGESVKVLISPN